MGAACQAAKQFCGKSSRKSDLFLEDSKCLNQLMRLCLGIIAPRADADDVVGGYEARPSCLQAQAPVPSAAAGYAASGPNPRRANVDLWPLPQASHDRGFDPIGPVRRPALRWPRSAGKRSPRLFSEPVPLRQNGSHVVRTQNFRRTTDSACVFMSAPRFLPRGLTANGPIQNQRSGQQNGQATSPISGRGWIGCIWRSQVSSDQWWEMACSLIFYHSGSSAGP